MLDTKRFSNALFLSRIQVAEEESGSQDHDTMRDVSVRLTIQQGRRRVEVGGRARKLQDHGVRGLAGELLRRSKYLMHER